MHKSCIWQKLESDAARMKSYFRGSTSFIGLMLGMLGVSQAAAQISIDNEGEAFTENFDSLTSSSPTSWVSGVTLPGVYGGGDGLITTSYRDGVTEKTSYGLNYTNPASDRALGMSLMGNFNSDTVWYGFRFVNNTGSTLYSVEVSYYVERYFGWADVDSRFDEGFQVYTAVSPTVTGNPLGSEWTRQVGLEYHPAAGPVLGSSGPASYYSTGGYFIFDGNHADYRTEMSLTLGIVGGLIDGAEYWIMFGNTVAGVLGNKTNADGLAIDDLSVTFSTAAIPEPANMAVLIGAGLLGAVLTRRRGKR